MMRIGPIIITREHPAERTLRRWGQLSPELRELIARATRSIAKDAVQDIMDDQGLIYTPHDGDLIAKGTRSQCVPCVEPTHEHYGVLHDVSRETVPLASSCGVADCSVCGTGGEK